MKAFVGESINIDDMLTPVSVLVISGVIDHRKNEFWIMFSSEHSGCFNDWHRSLAN